MSGLNYTRKSVYGPSIIYTSTLAKKEGTPYFGKNVKVTEMYDKDGMYEKKKIVETFAEVEDSDGNAYTIKCAGQLAKKIEDADNQGVKEFDIVYCGKKDGYHQIGLHLWGHSEAEAQAAIAEGTLASYNMSFDEAMSFDELAEVNATEVKKVQDKVQEEVDEDLV